jgi:membrane protein
MRVQMLQGSGIFELGERSIRKFFEHRMATYAAALAYRGLFGIFPFLLILVVLAGALGFTGFFDRLVEQTSSEPTQQVPQQLEPVVEQGREQSSRSRG